MTPLSGPLLVARLEADLDHLPFPAFLVDVADGTFTYRCSNGAHRAALGYLSEDFAGKTSKDIMPARVSNGLERHYKRCRDTGIVQYYDEVIETDQGAQWWRKGLTPIRDRKGAVVAILGGAVDISEEKTALFDLTNRLARLSQAHETADLERASDTAQIADHLRAALGAFDVLRDAVMDLEDPAIELLGEGDRAVRSALAHIEAMNHRTYDQMSLTPRLTEIDFAHACADLAALLDPSDRYRISYCEATLEADRVLLQLTLRALLHNALLNAKGWVSIDVDDAPDGGLLISVTDDGAGVAHGLRAGCTPVLPTGAAPHPLDDLKTLLTHRGGSLRLAESSEVAGVTVIAHLPGRLLEGDALDWERYAV